MNFLNYLTLFAYIALSADVLLQIKHIYHTKSSRDISIAGLAIRFIAIVIILIKFISLGDMPLAIRQTLIAITFTTYLSLTIVYLIHRRKSK